jgi:hypothetical protein
MNWAHQVDNASTRWLLQVLGEPPTSTIGGALETLQRRSLGTRKPEIATGGLWGSDTPGKSDVHVFDC